MSAAGMVWFPIIDSFPEYACLRFLIEETLPGGGTETLTAWEHYADSWCQVACFFQSVSMHSWAEAYWNSFISME